MVKYLGKLMITVLVGLLAYKYFAEPTQFMNNYIYGFVTMYVILLILSIVLVSFVFLIHNIVAKFGSTIDKESKHTLVNSLDNFYNEIGNRKKWEVMYTPILSLITIFFAYQLGLWFLVITEALSESLNIRLGDKARRYLYIKRNLEEKTR
ncbi:MAG: hypothetical protein ACOCQD_04270 [archaeon]